jgi:hypothetical protein
MSFSNVHMPLSLLNIVLLCFLTPMEELLQVALISKSGEMSQLHGMGKTA